LEPHEGVAPHAQWELLRFRRLGCSRCRGGCYRGLLLRFLIDLIIRIVEKAATGFSS
tara:strand:+ start:5691 stop:5861 length:171 start_codon:yes stop_codon:yes gene_type:complete